MVQQPEDDYLYPRVRRVIIRHEELRQLIESHLGYPLPADTRFYASRDCYGDAQVHLFMESREFPPHQEATLTMQGVEVLEPRR